MSDKTSPQLAEFQPVEIDEIDAKLNETARSKGIPTLSFPDPAPTDEQQKPEVSIARPRRKTLSTEIPDQLWIALKVRAAQEMVSVRHIVLSALKQRGFDIDEDELIEDGRRLR